jgi:hypothetical protein
LFRAVVPTVLCAVKLGEHCQRFQVALQDRPPRTAKSPSDLLDGPIGVLD